MAVTKMSDNNDLVDIRTVKMRENSSRVENALFLIEQLKSHTHFRNGDYVIEVEFMETDRTLSDALVSYLQQKMRA